MVPGLQGSGRAPGQLRPGFRDLLSQIALSMSISLSLSLISLGSWNELRLSGLLHRLGTVRAAAVRHLACTFHAMIPQRLLHPGSHGCLTPSVLHCLPPLAMLVFVFLRVASIG